MNSKPIQADGLASLREQIDAAAADGFRATLAIAFVSVEHDLGEAAKVFADRDIDLFGGTSSGEIMASGGTECVFEQSIVALLMDPPAGSYDLGLFETPAGSDFRAVGERIGRWAKDTFDDPALLLLVSGLLTNAEEVVVGIGAGAGSDVPLYGGLAGDDYQLQSTWVLTGEESVAGAVLALCFDQARVRVRGVAASGWNPVGVEKTITRSEGNVVYTIDEKPALDVYMEYLGLTSDTDIVVAEYPLHLVKDGYTTLRASLVIDPENRSLVFGGNVPEGAKVRFAAPPGVEITEAAIKEMRKLQETAADAEALVLFSCKARHFALGPMAEDEVLPMQRLWDAPLVGFFSYGEIGPSEAGKCDFHNESCVLVTLSETTGA